jgi:hypothetical protein
MELLLSIAFILFFLGVVIVVGGIAVLSYSNRVYYAFMNRVLETINMINKAR